MDGRTVVATILFLLSLNTEAKSRIKISNNGYTDIVVAFHHTVKPEVGEPLIDKLKDIFTSGSAALYRATRKRSYFKQVTILVPKSWPRRSTYQVASDEVFTQSDIRINEPNPIHGDAPYTSQPMPCGSPGSYIHLTPNYLRYLTANSTEKFGDPGRTLVHEWAHLRYGVFDEYYERGRPEFPAFYRHHKTEEVLPNACVNHKLIGRRWNEKKRIDCASGDYTMPDPDCIFIADKNNNDQITSSITSYHFLPNAYMFCDDTDEFKHDKFAPNRHNRMCNERSTWSVISNNEDFKNKNPPVDITTTTPSFKIVQEQDATISLVLDISGSMNSPAGHTKIMMLYEAATRFLKEEIKFGTAVAVITFSNIATLKQPMIQITNEQQRQQVINHIPQSASGGTCIGCGLRTAAADLKRFRGGANGGTIVLLSDGEENGSPYIHEVTSEIVNQKIRVITIAFTEYASKNMEDLAIATGGKSFFAPTSASVIKLDAAFYEVSTVQATEEDLTEKVNEKRFEKTTSSFESEFLIDDSIGRDTVVKFVYNDRDDINGVTINGPGLSASLLTSSSGNIQIEDDRKLKQIRFIFKSLMTGTYKYVVNRRGSTSQDMTVTVLSKARIVGDQPISVECRVDEIQHPTEPPKILITAHVKKGTRAIIKAEVIAKIDRPNNQKSIVIQIFDSGKNGDLARDDGIYSGYFTQFGGQGRYSVQANVVSKAETAILESGFTSSNAIEILTVQSIPPNITEVPTGNFQRVAEAGSIQINQNLNAETTDLFPPSRIDDLQLLNVTGEHALLEWSAPGDDLTNGQAAEYDMRFTMDFERLSSEFYGRRYTGTPSPKPAGQTERLNVKLIGLSSTVTYFVAIRTKDKTGKSSETSNIVTVKGV